MLGTWLGIPESCDSEGTSRPSPHRAGSRGARCSEQSPQLPQRSGRPSGRKDPAGLSPSQEPGCPSSCPALPALSPRAAQNDPRGPWPPSRGSPDTAGPAMAALGRCAGWRGRAGPVQGTVPALDTRGELTPPSDRAAQTADTAGEGGSPGVPGATPVGARCHAPRTPGHPSLGLVMPPGHLVTHLWEWPSPQDTWPFLGHSVSTQTLGQVSGHPALHTAPPTSRRTWLHPTPRRAALAANGVRGAWLMACPEPME